MPMLSEGAVMPKAYDTIIVGAGPAGGTAAFFLGQAGQRVLVLEKEALPRYKACGGGLSVDMLEVFPFSFEPVIERRVKAVRYALGNQAVTIPLPSNSMCMVMRDRFDAYLLGHAQAEVRDGTAVQSVEEIDGKVLVTTRDGEQLAASHLIGADGANSVVAHSLGLRRNKALAAAIEVEATVPEEKLVEYGEVPLLAFGEVAHGYVWIFAKADHLSVGIGNLHPRPGELQSRLKAAMAHYGISLEGYAMHGHAVPFFTRYELLATGRSLLTGDAAGLVDPFTGEGIRFAIHSGRLAAQAILSDRIERYTNWINRRIKFNYVIAALLARSFFRYPDEWFAFAARRPSITRAFVDSISGRASYLQIILRLAGGLPEYLSRRMFAWGK